MCAHSTEGDSVEYPYADAEANKSHAYLLPAIRRQLSGLPSGARVMDLGCGNGSLTAAWARSDWQVYGVDSSESGIQNAKAAFPEIQFSCNQVTPELAATYGAASFDAVVAAEVIEHVYLPRSLVSCAFQLLRPGGIFVVTTPYNGYLKNLAIAVCGRMDDHWTVLWDGGHIKFWSWKTIRVVLEEGGFELPQFAGAGRVRFLWKSMVVACRKP